MKYAIYTNGLLLCRIATLRQARKVIKHLQWLGKENVKLVCEL